MGVGTIPITGDLRMKELNKEEKKFRRECEKEECQNAVNKHDAFERLFLKRYVGIVRILFSSYISDAIYYTDNSFTGCLRGRELDDGYFIYYFEDKHLGCCCFAVLKDLSSLRNMEENKNG